MSTLNVGEPTVEQIIEGFRRMPLPLGERASSVAAYLLREPGVMVSVEHIDGTVAHFVQSIRVDDFEAWHVNGRFGEPIRVETTRFEIDIAPQAAG